MGAGEIFQGEGSGGRGGGKRGAREKEAGIRGEGSGGWGPNLPNFKVCDSLSVILFICN